MKYTQRGTGAVIAVTLGFCLYLPLLSRHYDLNGIAEARAFDLGALFSQNHMLYRPLAFLVKEGLNLVGISPHTVAILQILTAVLGALTLGTLFLVLSKLTDDLRAAAVGTGWLAITFSFWYFSTDIAYIVPAAFFAASGFALLVYLKSPLLVGFAAGLAILVWQANIFLLPFFILGPFVLRLGNQRKKFRYAINLLVACAVIAAGTYLIVGNFVLHHAGVGETISWATGYGGGRLPMWGQLSLERVHTIIDSAGASIYPFESRVGLGELVDADPPGIPQWRPAFVAFLALGFWPLAMMLWRPNANAAGGRVLFWLAVGYLSYLPFLIWWDPAESKWFAVPNLFVAAILAVLWHKIRWTLLEYMIAVIGILTIALSNLSTTIWPRRFTESPAIQLAQCVAGHMEEDDLFISNDWGWDGYLTYLYDRKAFNMIAESIYLKEKDIFFTALDASVARVQENGGSVYMPDLESYSSDFLAWLQSQTQLERYELERFSAKPAFVCGGMEVKRASLLPGIAPPTDVRMADAIPLRKNSDWIYAIPPISPSGAKIGYGQIDAYSGEGRMILRSVDRGIDLAETVLPAVQTIRGGIVYVENSSRISTALAIMNPSERIAQFSFCFRDDRGREFGCGKLDLPPRSQLARFLSASPFSCRAPCNAVLKFGSTVPVAVLGLRAARQPDSGLPVTRIPVVSSTGSSAQIVLLPPRIGDIQFGERELLLLNPGLNPISGSVTGWDRNDRRYRLLPGSFQRIVPMDSSAQLSGTLMFQSNEGPDPVPFAIMPVEHEEGRFGETLIAAATRSASFRTFIEFSARAGERSESRTVLSFYNPKPSDTNVILRLSSLQDPERAAETSMLLPGGRQETVDLMNLHDFRQLGRYFFGILVVTTSPETDLYVQAYRMLVNQRGIHLISPFPIEEGRSMRTKDRFFPHLPVVEDYSFRLIFWQFGQKVHEGMLRFFDQNGDPLQLNIVAQGSP